MSYEVVYFPSFFLLSCLNLRKMSIVTRNVKRRRRDVSWNEAIPYVKETPDLVYLDLVEIPNLEDKN